MSKPSSASTPSKAAAGLILGLRGRMKNRETPPCTESPEPASRTGQRTARLTATPRSPRPSLSGASTTERSTAAPTTVESLWRKCARFSMLGEPSVLARCTPLPRPPRRLKKRSSPIGRCAVSRPLPEKRPPFPPTIYRRKRKSLYIKCFLSFIVGGKVGGMVGGKVGGNAGEIPLRPLPWRFCGGKAFIPRP